MAQCYLILDATCSVAEFTQQEAAQAAGASGVGHVPWRRHSTLHLLSHLSATELRAVYSVPAASDADDLQMFARYDDEICEHLTSRASARF